MGRILTKFVYGDSARRPLDASVIKRENIRLTLPNALKIENVDHNFEPSTNMSEWLVIKEESYTPDKQLFIVDSFKKNFKNVKLEGNTEKCYDMIGKLASRSSVVSDWLAIANAEYSLEAQTPTYFKEHIEPKDFNNLQKSIIEFNKVIAKAQQDKQEAAENYKKQIQKIDNELDNKMKKFKSSNFLKILTLPSSALPITLQLAIENYTPTSDDSPTKRVYLREVLTNYKIYLLKEIKQNPNLDIDELIKNNSLK